MFRDVYASDFHTWPPVKEVECTEKTLVLISMPVSSLQPQTLQLDFLMKILPNYHHLKKTVKASQGAG